MAPVGILARLKNLYTKTQDEPVISAQQAALYSLALTLLYVVPFYLFSATRPSQTLSRDAPSVIRARIRAVTGSCLLSTAAVLWLFTAKGHVPSNEALRMMGWWPVGVQEIMRGLSLTAILFAGPLFERGVVYGQWWDWIRGRGVSESLRGWMGWRNFIAGPTTEEILFRSSIIPLHLLARVPPSRIIMVTPLYFGIAHVHHFYEFRLTHPDTSAFAALFRSVIQFGYTTVFGWYATFLYLRTGSLLAVIVVHSFCNWCGLPRLWGRVGSASSAGVPSDPPRLCKDKDGAESDRKKSGRWWIGWSLAYYVLLVAGIVGFYMALWPLTESPRALVSFTTR
ncbi:CaaX prenyl proteinase Rce1 [Aspergillus taichungensis]|uniref:intramembrane prenyl-peptidase Rce1 n=1 Tax=Aspergillus taichungensis TaxID=482145 RepID=A0A2J5HNK8_9EURO|nr:CaaX prenyl proteinase Rce1 [Aspergillus taichungensis]